MGIESIIVDTLNGLNPRCTNSSFAGIAKIHSRPRVEAGLSGREPFENETALQYLAVARKMKSLSDSVGLPLDWSEVEQIRSALDAIDNKTLHVSVHQEQPRVAAEPQYNVFLTDKRFYFAKRGRDVLGNLQIVGGYQGSGAARMTKDCALKLLAALTKAGHKAQLIPSASRDEDGAYNDFAALWGEPEAQQ